MMVWWCFMTKMRILKQVSPNIAYETTSQEQEIEEEWS
jgi:hypothetical protein